VKQNKNRNQTPRGDACLGGMSKYNGACHCQKKEAAPRARGCKWPGWSRTFPPYKSLAYHQANNKYAARGHYAFLSSSERESYAGASSCGAAGFWAAIKNNSQRGVRASGQRKATAACLYMQPTGGARSIIYPHPVANNARRN
jgi:hypothetical protein